MTKAEVARTLGKSARTVQRKLVELERESPELIRRQSGESVLVAESVVRLWAHDLSPADSFAEPLVDGQLESLAREAEMAQVAADAFEAEALRLASIRSAEKLEAAMLVLKHDLDAANARIVELEADRSRLRQALLALVDEKVV